MRDEETRTLLSLHLADLRRRGLSSGTTTARRIKVSALIGHHEPRSVLTLTHGEIQTFLDGRGLNVRTRYQWISHLHCFYEWAVLEGHGDDDPTTRIIRPKLPRLLPRPINDDDLDRAIALAPSTMKAWLVLAAYAGLRCAELSRLDTTDVVFGDHVLLVRGKGTKERVVPMHPVVEEALRPHSSGRSRPVFVHDSGERYDPAWISRRVSRYLSELSIDATAHQLRHWFGSRTYKACRDIRVVQELMGHANPITTAGYAAWSPTTAREAVLKIA